MPIAVYADYPAEETGAVLFLDEADALFGRRSEVKDSHDRYANAEVAYLLQRIDAFEGVVVLATNLLLETGQVPPDADWRRHIRQVVCFPCPRLEATASGLRGSMRSPCRSY